jgi:hypothetical protein
MQGLSGKPSLFHTVRADDSSSAGCTAALTVRAYGRPETRYDSRMLVLVRPPVVVVARPAIASRRLEVDSVLRAALPAQDGW